MLDGVRDSTFPVQVRHGSPAPGAIFGAIMAAGLDATEGGPVSYCLPYGSTPINVSVQAWREATRQFAGLADTGVTPPGKLRGCMLGQLCPPSLLIAITVLECMFFAQQGITSVSLSYAQQTHPGQDAEAVQALRSIASDLLPATAWHVVIYAYMGVYPVTRSGALRLLADAARLARRTGAARLIVKTAAEAKSPPMLTRRGPIRSMSGPTSGCATTNGTIWQKATIPVFATLPVVTRTYHGTAIDSSRVADRAAKSVLSTPTRPRSERVPF